MPRLLAWGLWSLVLAFCLGTGFAAEKVRRSVGDAAQTWKTIEATVSKADLSQVEVRDAKDPYGRGQVYTTHLEWVLDLRVVYPVGSRQVECTPSESAAIPSAPAVGWADRLKVGTKLTVYQDPGDPTRCALTIGTFTLAYILYAASGVLLLVTLGLGALFLRLVREPRPRPAS